MSYALREMFRDGLGESELNKRARIHLTDLAKHVDTAKSVPPGFSLKALAEACAHRTMKLGAADLDLWQSAGFGSRDAMAFMLARAGEISTSMFPILAGNTIINLVRKNMEDETVLQTAMQLVSLMPSNLQVDVIPGVNDAGAYDQVLEGQPFPQASAGEDSVQIGYKKFGEQLSLTDEMVMFDKTGEVTMRAEAMGRRAAREKGRYIIEMVIDRYTKTYKPAGVAEALYATTVRDGGVNKITGNALVDNTDLEAMRARLAKQTERDPLAAAKGKKRYFVVPFNVILVPDALYGLAWQLTQLQLAAKTTNVADANMFYGKKVISHPILDEVSTTTWYGGDPQAQFKLKQVKPLSITRVDGASSGRTLQGVAFDVKVEDWYEVGAIAYEHFVQSTT